MPEDNIARQVKAAAHYRCQRVAWRIRPLPDFLIIGAQKSGTSSLYHYLRQHPQLLPSSTKEVHFFDGGMEPDVDNFQRGAIWYRRHFSMRKYIGPNKVYEASPLYIFNPLVPKRIADLLPQAKLIIMLRNPTDRAISQYFHVRRHNGESLPLIEALQAEEQRLKPVIAKGDYKSATFIQHSYKSRGRYYRQIKRFLDYFPRGNILIMNSGRFFAAPHEALRRVFEFVGVDANARVADVKPRNVGTNRSDVEPEVYEYLDDYFTDDNEALYNLVGERYDW